MEKEKTMPPAVADAPGPRPAPARSPWRKWATALLVGLVCLAGLDRGRHPGCSKSPYDRFPRAGDPFRFLPCTNATLPPALEDADAHRSWAGLFDPDPEHWSWANATTDDDGPEDAQAGRAIYLCGYLDVPLDYTNQSDARIVRLAVTKLQVSGPARRRDPGGAAGRKSERTIVFRGDLNHTLRNPVLLIAETYDPATPLRNGRRLLAEMGRANARLVAHHGYGHSSRDASRCTDAIARAWVRDGVLPDALETACFADEKPYRYPDDVNKKPAAAGEPRDPVLTLWDHHLAHLALHNPSLLPRRRGGGRLQN
ncbi:protease [Ophiocordyceps sinensis CO18]|uniref:Protease n=1 Tax=Ophiocordyceps sinensis (strain Co18 / CGMCC 3.14243) TaxID=911162 RepID=T5AMV2_OPHSC|nr:protease [Ophiocordyceps sinensis CO18]